MTEQGGVAPASPWVDQTLAALAAAPGDHTVLLTVNNRVLRADGTPSPFQEGEVTLRILADPARRAEHVRQIVAASAPADGVEINYERFPPSARDTFTAFVRELRAALPQPKLLSIVLQPKTTNAPGWHGQAIDWRAIEPYADHLRIMAYHYSWSTSPPGPVVPMETLAALASYALHDPEQSIPASKLSVILNVWGWDWALAPGVPGRLVEWSEAMRLRSASGAPVVRDPAQRTIRFRYADATGAPHEVWIDDAQALRARVALLQGAGVPRVDLWTLGSGDPAFWRWVGAGGDDGAVAAPVDFGGDARTDPAVFRPAEGRWLAEASSEPGARGSAVYGTAGDVPLPLDWSGDGTADFAVFRPASATWLLDLDRNGGTDLRLVYGRAGDVPVPGDYDGDGRADVAVYRPASGAWFVDLDRNGGTDLRLAPGGVGEVPVPADYDGDGSTDAAAFAAGRWRIDLGSDGTVDVDVAYGAPGDVPLPGDYDGDGAADPAVFRPQVATWFVDHDRDGASELRVVYGQGSDVPVPGDFDGDGATDFAVWRPASGRWLVDTNHTGGTDLAFALGAPGDRPLRPNGWVLDTLAPPP